MPRTANNVGDRVFGLIREARDGKSIEALVDAATERDVASVDLVSFVNPKEFSVPEQGKVLWNDIELLSTAKAQVANTVGVPPSLFDTLDADIVELIIRRNIQSSPHKIRLWNYGDDKLVRAFVSPDYTPVPATRLVNQLLDANRDRLNALKITAVHNLPETMKVDVIDVDQGFDTNILGDPGPVPDNIVFPGWQFNVNDIGKASTFLNSLLWVLVCNNGSAVVDATLAMRAIHRGGAEFRGSIVATDQWKSIVTESKAEKLLWIPEDRAIDKLKKLANRPALDILSDVWQKVYHHEDTILHREITSRWELAQAFSDTANFVSPSNRTKLQTISGQLLLQPTSNVLPVLHEMVL